MKIFISKITFIGIVCVLLSHNANAQSSIVTGEISQAITKFRFFDQDNTLDKSYSFVLSKSYHFGYMYALDNGLYFNSSLGFRNGGATYIYDDSNYSWDFNYFNFRIGGGYALALNSLDVYLGVSPYFSHMLTGYQTLNNQAFDIVRSKDIKRGDIGLYISPGAQYNISDGLSAYFQFDNILGIKNLEPKESGQKSRNIGFALTLGVAVTLN